jgi:hypothetical protein
MEEIEIEDLTQYKSLSGFFYQAVVFPRPGLVWTMPSPESAS